MVYTPPPTKALNDNIGSSGWNTYIRDNFSWLYNNGRDSIGCRVRHTTGQNFAGAGITTEHQFNTEDIDTDGFHSTVTNPNRVTIPTNLGGIYAVTYYVVTFNNWTSSQMILRRNGIAIARTSLNNLFETLTYTGGFNAGDYITAGIYNGSASLF